MHKGLQLAVLGSVLLTLDASARVIYGEDHRVEVFESTAFQQKLARSAATMISRFEISPNGPGIFKVNQSSLQNWLETLEPLKRREELFSKEVLDVASLGFGFCQSERFINQPNPGMCSGFLIAPDLLITAGHCVKSPSFCSEYRWVFGFQVEGKSDSAGLSINTDDIYSCKKVVSNTLSMPLGLDYAIVKLDRVVKGREALEIRNASKVEDYTPLLVIGSPSGLPLKVAGGAHVRKNSHPFYFNANLDSFQGNSGSAVFNAETGMVEGILVRGEEDFRPNILSKCIESNRCENDKCRGEDITRLTAIPEIGMQGALYRAATSGNLKNLKSILKLDLWVDFYGKDGQSALIKATINGQIDAMRVLILKGADVNLVDASGISVINHAFQNGHYDAVSLLLINGAKLGH